MSRQQHTILLEPGKAQQEHFVFYGFSCPNCNGSGGFSYSGYTAKFKENFDAPDWKACDVCAGTGRLKANVAVEWVPDEKKKL